MVMIVRYGRGIVLLARVGWLVYVDVGQCRAKLDDRLDVVEKKIFFIWCKCMWRLLHQLIGKGMT